MTCAQCKRWLIDTSPLKREGYALCEGRKESERAGRYTSDMNRCRIGMFAPHQSFAMTNVAMLPEGSFDPNQQSGRLL